MKIVLPFSKKPAYATLTIVMLLLSCILLTKTQPAFAQTTGVPPQFTNGSVPADENYDTFIQNINKSNQTGQPNTDSFYGATIFSRMTMGLLRLMIGDMATNPSQANASGTVDTNDGLIGFAGSAMGVMYANQPASGIQYMADMAKTAHIIPQSYAQTGFFGGGSGPSTPSQQGFDKIGGLQQLWSAMRDFAYLLYIPLFIYIGLMIMFRQSVGGKSAATIQSALPRIALSLILVTLSFAIVGFMIDIMNYSMALIVSYFISKGLIVSKNGNTDIYSYLYNQNIFSMAWDPDKLNIAVFANTPAEALSNIVKSIVTVHFVNNLLGGVTDVLAKVIIVGALIFVIFQTFFTLVKAYVTILIMTILGPLYIAFNSIPGTGTTGLWFRNLLANLVVFPAVLAVLLFAAVVGNVSSITGQNNQNTSFVYQQGTSSGWTPPFLNIGETNPTGDITAIIGFGSILMLPTLLGMMQKFFKAATPPIYFAPVTQSIAALTAAAKRPFQTSEYEERRKREQERQDSSRNKEATP